MTFMTDTRPAADIIGPFSAWPRETQPKPARRKYTRAAIYATLVSGTGVFFHCVVPMIA